MAWISFPHPKDGEALYHVEVVELDGNGNSDTFECIEYKDYHSACDMAELVNEGFYPF